MCFSSPLDFTSQTELLYVPLSGFHQHPTGLMAQPKETGLEGMLDSTCPPTVYPPHFSQPSIPSPTAAHRYTSPRAAYGCAGLSTHDVYDACTPGMHLAPQQTRNLGFCPRPSSAAGCGCGCELKPPLVHLCDTNKRTEWARGVCAAVISVITSDGRTIVGMLRGFDQTTNLILEDCHERVYSTQVCNLPSCASRSRTCDHLLH
jgi:hypothetical protein